MGWRRAWSRTRQTPSLRAQQSAAARPFCTINGRNRPIRHSQPRAPSPTSGQTMTVQEGDEGHSIRVIVTATDGDADASQASATSNPTLLTLDVVPTLSVSVNGTAQEGSVLTATPTIGTDVDGGNAVTYQWQSSTNGVTWTG